MKKAEGVVPRYKRTAVCKECGECADSRRCTAARVAPRDYNGIRFTADGFDCALPVSMDSHNACAFKCLYCFSNFLGGHGRLALGQFNARRLERVLAGESRTRLDRQMHLALKRDTKRPCPIQFGALTDPFDNIERAQGWALRLPAILARYGQPVRVSTKGRLLMLPEYLNEWSRPELVWVAFSIITTDDELLAQIDKYAPSATDRLRTMAALSARGVSTSLRLRPAVPGVSDCTTRRRGVHKELIERAAAAGARAVSVEVLFCPGKPDKRYVYHWDELERLSGFALRDMYRAMTPRWGACVRPAKAWTENFLHECREVTKACGMTFGVSDPTWKELNDYGCCCGIPPDDPVFGNWQREQATNVVVEARRAFEAGDVDRLWGVESVIPAWASGVRMRDMIIATGDKGRLMNEYTWAEKLRYTWNDVASARGPLKYFQGALIPVRRDANGNVLYRFNAVARKRLKTVWKLGASE